MIRCRLNQYKEKTMSNDKKCDWCGRLFTGDWVIGGGFFSTKGFCSEKCRSEYEKKDSK